MPGPDYVPNSPTTWSEREQNLTGRRRSRNSPASDSPSSGEPGGRAARASLPGGQLATDEPVFLAAGERVQHIPAGCVRLLSDLSEECFDFGEGRRATFSSELNRGCQVLGLHVRPSHVGEGSTGPRNPGGSA